MLSLVLLLSFVGLSAAAFEVPFEHDSFRMDGMTVDVSAFNISIGNPPQTIRVAFDTQASRGVYGAASNLLLYTSNELGLAVFNRSRSQTFHKTALLYNDMNGPMGVIGRDVIQIGEEKKAGAEIHVSHETGSYYPLFHLNLATDGSPSFVSSLLKDEQVITIVFDTVNGFDLKLEPADYINYKGKDYDDCFVTFYESGDDSATLPPGALRNHCLLFDYANFQVGIASKL
ncbi:hypothetical protein M3Y99_01743400 [Aphelenchoides fujianensis]|nr:hypothetical protein M3Y99_01743400 [Aphelenchoides fujianensis]